MIPVVMEEGCTDNRLWGGTVGGKLATKLYVNLVDEHDNPEMFRGSIERLMSEICTVGANFLLRDTNKLFPHHLIGTRVSHDIRGAGNITKILENGRRVVEFDSGDEHTYKPRSMDKLRLISTSSANSTTSSTSSANSDFLPQQLVELEGLEDEEQLKMVVSTDIAAHSEPTVTHRDGNGAAQLVSDRL